MIDNSLLSADHMPLRNKIQNNDGIFTAINAINLRERT